MTWSIAHHQVAEAAKSQSLSDLHNEAFHRTFINLFNLISIQNNSNTSINPLLLAEKPTKRIDLHQSLVSLQAISAVIGNVD